MNCDRVQIKFEMGQPRRPFEQLMCVFPKQSSHALPFCYRWLMSSSDSPIIDFYPINFRLDVNGAAYAWMGVNLLPFIDQERLFKAMEKADNDQKNLTPEEQNRNKRTGDIFVYFRKTKTPALKCVKLKVEEKYVASFTAKERISG
jgi:5'-3' exoribonuclease 2